jgi:hypothetical protein
VVSEQCDDKCNGTRRYALTMPLLVSSEADTPPVTVAGIREMGKVKLEKRQKAWLVEAVNACLAYIDLLESKEDGKDSKVRLELRELKTHPGTKGSKAKVRPPKPDANLIKLEATAKAKELKARIRAAKMMLQGIFLQPGAAGSSTRTRRTGPGTCPSAMHCLDCSHSGRSDRNLPGYYRAAAATVESKNGIKTPLRPPGRPGGRDFF